MEPHQFWLGLPSSSSHALVGGTAGAAVASTGSIQVVLIESLRKIGVFIIISPRAGLAIALLMTLAIMWGDHSYTPG